MTTAPARLSELLDDLRAERRVLDDLLASLQLADWRRLTPAQGWQIRHQVVHLELFDEVAAQCVAGDSSPLAGIRDRAARSQGSEDELSLSLLLPRADDAPDELLSGWRRAGEELLRQFESAPPDRRVLWAAGPMALESFATARLMETWTHGLDCFAAVGVEPVDTDRIRHVCHIGYRALPYGFRRAGVPMPGPLDQLRLELDAPSGGVWHIGPPDATAVIRGPAGEWARLAVQRMSLADAQRLIPNSELAERALMAVRAFA